MTKSVFVLLIVVVTLAALGGACLWLQDGHDERTVAIEQPATGTRLAVPALSAPVVETAHYAITSAAPPAQTGLVAEAVESLHGAYTAFFGNELTIEASAPKLQLVLYKDRNQFKAHNRSSPWAEAFYLFPQCHAYYADGYPNPYHWMVHEATHQLSNEVAHFRKARWVDEGLATYFGASQIQDGKLMPGSIDVNAYPIWWLKSLPLSGVLEDDIQSGGIIPLRALISDTGPPIGQHVNLYYIEYWSLSHFMFHYRNGKYAKQYKALIAHGATLEAFEKSIGPVDQIQREWYEYLREKIIEAESLES
jgi:hypothetical protein